MDSATNLDQGAPDARELGQSACESLASEWERIAASGSADLTTWQQDLDKLAAEERALRVQGAWVRGRDDFFGVLNIQGAEVRHSAMVAWLLDPCAAHGLGVRFLERFLAAGFGSEAVQADLATASTRCEMQAGGGRVDIVVEASGLFLVIENKLYSPEGDGQCDYYYGHLKGPDALFLFLTPDGRPPVSANGEAADAYRSMSYRVVRDVLDAALAESTPQRSPRLGRHIAEDYLRTLKKEFR